MIAALAGIVVRLALAGFVVVVRAALVAVLGLALARPGGVLAAAFILAGVEKPRERRHVGFGTAAPGHSRLALRFVDRGGLARRDRDAAPGGPVLDEHGAAPDLDAGAIVAGSDGESGALDHGGEIAVLHGEMLHMAHFGLDRDGAEILLHGGEGPYASFVVNLDLRVGAERHMLLATLELDIAVVERADHAAVGNDVVAVELEPLAIDELQHGTAQADRDPVVAKRRDRRQTKKQRRKHGAHGDGHHEPPRITPRQVRI